MQGTTTRYDRVRGYGFIIPDDLTQPDYFVHSKHILEPKGRRFLMAGWRVEFTPVTAVEGLQAHEVRILSRTIAIQHGGAK
jgi:cold shock CspA family protein